MEGTVNYQKELDKIIEKLCDSDQGGNGKRKVPTLLLHSCCAPCSSYCMEYLRQFFDLTVFYYNPNITQQSEYRLRAEEEKRLIRAFNELPTEDGRTIKIMEGDYEPERFLEMAKGLEQCPEGGERCFRCYELRLRKTAEKAKELGFDFFTTTLTISPLKNAAKLNEIGMQLAKELDVNWLVSDFKKKNGYKRSIELSQQYHLYRQNYCGCGFSKAESMKREIQKAGKQSDREN